MFFPVYLLNTYAFSSSLIQFAFTLPLEVRRYSLLPSLIVPLSPSRVHRCAISHRKFPGIFFGCTMTIVAGNLHLIDRCGVDIAISVNVYRGVAINTLHSSFKMYIFSHMQIFFRKQSSCGFACSSKGGACPSFT